MNLLTRIVRKCFLIKEIVSKEGEVHFRRYRLLATPWFNLYLHNIRRSDKDRHSHDHPWHFFSLIISGAYGETYRTYPHFDAETHVWYKTGMVIMHNARDVHKITLLTPQVWTLVLTSGRERVWGYRTKSGWIDFKKYRQLKRDGQLPE